jgi:hypothetical protein
MQQGRQTCNSKRLGSSTTSFTRFKKVTAWKQHSTGDYKCEDLTDSRNHDKQATQPHTKRVATTGELLSQNTIKRTRGWSGKRNPNNQGSKTEAS